MSLEEGAKETQESNQGGYIEIGRKWENSPLNVYDVLRETEVVQGPKSPDALPSKRRVGICCHKANETRDQPSKSSSVCTIGIGRLIDSSPVEIKKTRVTKLSAFSKIRVLGNPQWIPSSIQFLKQRREFQELRIYKSMISVPF